MIDRTIHFFRMNDGEACNNHELARFGWAVITVAALTLVFFAAGELMPSSSSSSTAAAFGALQETMKVIFAILTAFIFTASLVWPVRRIEAWLDENYPDHVAEDALDYSFREDLLASTAYAGMWGFRFVVGYAVMSIWLSMTAIYTEMAESGYPLSAGDVERLTVINSFAIAALTSLLAGVAFLWLIDWSMKDTVEELNTWSNNTFGKRTESTRTSMTDGGEADGA